MKPGLGGKTLSFLFPWCKFRFSPLSSPCTQKFLILLSLPLCLQLSSQQPLKAMGSWESHLYEQPPEKLEEFIQNYLRPSEDCQKDIDQSVDTICAVLQKPCQSLTVTGVAKVSRWLGSVLLGPGRKKDLALSTCCVPGPWVHKTSPCLSPHSSDGMEQGVEFRGTRWESADSAPCCCVTRGRLLNLSVPQCLNV